VNFTVYKHNWDKFDDNPVTAELLSTVISACEKIPFFIWPNKTNKSAKSKDHCFLQSVVNAWMEAELVGAGWDAEVAFKTGRNVRTDFGAPVTRDKKCLVEVEFGNQARIDSDLRKLLDAYHWGMLQFGIVILPRSQLAAITTGGCATYEQAVADVSSCHPKTVPFPVCIIGLDQRNCPAVDLSQSKLTNPDTLSGNSNKVVLHHIVSEYRAGVCLSEIAMPTGLEELEIIQKRSLRCNESPHQCALF